MREMAGEGRNGNETTIFKRKEKKRDNNVRSISINTKKKRRVILRADVPVAIKCCAVKARLKD